jgi:murein DD-endopeptidase MepM/ murein hydrolase activator NlpD
MKKFKLVTLATLLFALSFTMVSTAVPRGILQAEPSPTDVDWATYTDPRFDYAVEYPNDWFVVPRNDSDPNAMSTVLEFTSVNPQDENISNDSDHSLTIAQRVIIGLYLAEISDQQSLEAWTDLYENASAGFAEGILQRQPRRILRVAAGTAISEKGISPITEYQFTNLSHGKTVWFIWTNNTDSAFYDAMVQTFQFGENTPTSLRDIYGNDFQPLKLDQMMQESETDAKGTGSTSKVLGSFLKTKGFTEITMLSSSWWSPVIGDYNVRCGSEFHTGESQYAADVGTPLWTNVYAAQEGRVYFAGWHNQGYGNLIKISSGLGHYYAHLNAIYVANSDHVSRAQFIAHSGNTGFPGTAIHLHFHVNYTDLTGMTGFAPCTTAPQPPCDVNYPSSTVGNCGRMGR